MRGAHNGIELTRRVRVAFQFQQAFSDYTGLGFSFALENFQHRELAEFAEVVLFHARLRLRVANKRSSSRQPTMRFCHSRMPCVKADLELPTVAGTFFSSSA